MRSPLPYVVPLFWPGLLFADWRSIDFSDGYLMKSVSAVDTFSTATGIISGNIAALLFVVLNLFVLSNPVGVSVGATVGIGIAIGIGCYFLMSWLTRGVIFFRAGGSPGTAGILREQFPSVGKVSVGPGMTVSRLPGGGVSFTANGGSGGEAPDWVKERFAHMPTFQSPPAPSVPSFDPNQHLKLDPSRFTIDHDKIARESAERKLNSTDERRIQEQLLDFAIDKYWESKGDFAKNVSITAEKELAFAGLKTNCWLALSVDVSKGSLTVELQDYPEQWSLSQEEYTFGILQSLQDGYGKPVIFAEVDIWGNFASSAAATSPC